MSTFVRSSFRQLSCKSDTYLFLDAWSSLYIDQCSVSDNMMAEHGLGSRKQNSHCTHSERLVLYSSSCNRVHLYLVVEFSLQNRSVLSFFLFLQCKALIQDNKNSPALWGILDWCTPLNTFCYNLTMSSLISSFISFNINYIRILGTSYHTDVHMQTSEISSAVTYWK